MSMMNLIDKMMNQRVAGKAVVKNKKPSPSRDRAFLSDEAKITSSLRHSACRLRSS
jgi:hypothetical protein